MSTDKHYITTCQYDIENDCKLPYQCPLYNVCPIGHTNTNKMPIGLLKENEYKMTKAEEIKELKAEIELMKEVIIALAKITVSAGFNCTYPEKDKFYNLLSKMKD